MIVCKYVTALNGYKPVACFISETLICEPHPVQWLFLFIEQKDEHKRSSYFATIPKSNENDSGSFSGHNICKSYANKKGHIVIKQRNLLYLKVSPVGLEPTTR